MKLSDIIRNISRLFEKKRKNPVQLGVDSNLESNLKPLKVSSENTPIHISETEVNIDGSFTVNGESLITEATDVDSLNDLSDVSYSSGDLTITDLDTIIAGGGLTLDAVNDVSIDADGGEIYFKHDGTSHGYIHVGTSNELHIVGAANYLVKIQSLGGGDIDLASADNITIDAADTLTIDTDGTFVMKKDGTEFSAANSAYAGMILGYTDIGLDEAVASYNLTTSYAVPTSEFSVTFVAPPSGNVEIFIQIQFDCGGNGAGDLYAGLSDNATYNTIEDINEELIIDQSGRFGLDTVQHIWTKTGLTAGTSYTYYVGFKSSSTTGTPHIQWGGDAANRSADFIMKATALPNTITT